MATIWFSPPVFVKTELVGVSYACNNVRGAAEQLLKWPKKGTQVATCVGPLPCSLRSRGG